MALKMDTPVVSTRLAPASRRAIGNADWALPQPILHLSPSKPTKA